MMWWIRRQVSKGEATRASAPGIERGTRNRHESRPRELTTESAQHTLHHADAHAQGAGHLELAHALRCHFTNALLDRIPHLRAPQDGPLRACPRKSRIHALADHRPLKLGEH